MVPRAPALSEGGSTPLAPAITIFETEVVQELPGSYSTLFHGQCVAAVLPESPCFRSFGLLMGLKTCSSCDLGSMSGGTTQRLVHSDCYTI